MNMIFKGMLVAFWMIFVPLAVGRLPFGKTRQPVLVERYIAGFLVLFAFTEIVTVPMIRMKGSLHTLTIVYGVVALLLAVLGIFQSVRQKDKIEIKGVICKENCYLYVAAALILFQILMCCLLAHMDADDSFYIAQATTDVQTDTLLQVNPYTGLQYYGMPKRYALSPFPIFLAVISNLSAGLHPAIIAHMIYPVIFLPAVYMVQYLIAGKWFEGKRRAQGIYLFFIACICSFSAYSVYNSQNFQMVRIWQGKALLTSMLLPFIFYLCHETGLHERDKHLWFMLLLADASCCFVSSMGIMLGALMVGILSVVNMVLRRNIRVLFKGMLCCAPSIILGIFYIVVF